MDGLVWILGLNSSTTFMVTVLVQTKRVRTKENENRSRQPCKETVTPTEIRCLVGPAPSPSALIALIPCTIRKNAQRFIMSFMYIQVVTIAFLQNFFTCFMPISAFYPSCIIYNRYHPFLIFARFVHSRKTTIFNSVGTDMLLFGTKHYRKPAFYKS